MCLGVAVKENVKFDEKRTIDSAKVVVMGHREGVLTVGCPHGVKGLWPEYIENNGRVFEFHHRRFRRGIERQAYKSKAAFVEVSERVEDLIKIN